MQEKQGGETQAEHGPNVEKIQASNTLSRNSEPANMAPVINILDTWGAETPFSQISESAVGDSVLAVSELALLTFCVNSLF